MGRRRLGFEEIEGGRRREQDLITGGTQGEDLITWLIVSWIRFNRRGKLSASLRSKGGVEIGHSHGWVSDHKLKQYARQAARQ